VKSTNLLLVVGSLFLGAFLSHYAWPHTVLAQAQQIPPAAPSIPQAPNAQAEVRAQRFTFVNEKNEVQAMLSVVIDQQNRPTIVLEDRTGREMWSAGGSGLRQLSMK
jgi:hypothetical protein